MKAYNYVCPQTLEECSNLLIENEGRAHIINGGTDLIVRMREELTVPDLVVDIKKIDPNMHEITITEDRVIIGACAKISDIADNEYIKENFSFLAEAANSVGSWQVRNRATCSGNLCNASPLADTATPLLCLDAIMHVYSEGKMKEIPITEFFIHVRKTALKLGDVVTAISFENKPVKGIFSKFSRRKEVDLSTVCGTVVLKDGNFKMAFGSVAPTPLRLYKTEEFINSNEDNEENRKKAMTMASEEVSPISDIRASADYRKEMVYNTLGLAFEKLGGTK